MSEIWSSRPPLHNGHTSANDSDLHALMSNLHHVFADVTNTVSSDGPATHSAAQPLAKKAVSKEPTTQHGHNKQHGSGAGATNVGDSMLIRGDVLTASKLLQLAHSQQPIGGANAASDLLHEGRQQQQQLAAARGNRAYPFWDLEAASHSPSAASTPLSVANAVLVEDDDEESNCAVNNNNNQGVGSCHQQQQHQPGDDRRSVERQLSFLSVSASSRDDTPVSPMYAMFSTQPQQQQQATQQQPTTVSTSAAATPQLSLPTLMMMTAPPPPPPAMQHQQQLDAVRPTIRRVSASSPAEQHTPVAAVVVIEFKRSRRIRFRCPFGVDDITVGSFCVVQFDMTGALDAGLVTLVVQPHERHTLPRSVGHMEQGTVLRAANVDDCCKINNVLPNLEEAALAMCHQLIHFLHLPFTCVDAEYTFDERTCRLTYQLSPQACTSIVPNVSRLQRELSFKLQAKVLLEQVRR